SRSAIKENNMTINESSERVNKETAPVTRNLESPLMGNTFSKSISIEEINMVKNAEAISIPLTQGTNAEHTLFRVKRGSTVHIHPDADLLGREIVLYTNYPHDDKKFKRTEYRILHWFLKSGKKITTNKYNSLHVVDSDIYTEVKMNMSGTFRFWYHFKENVKQEIAGSLFIQVEPNLCVGPAGAQKIIPLDSVRCQTVLSKLLGPINTWEGKLRIAKETGYNMVHFTPIQELGGSKSAYSLRNQLRVNPHFAAGKGAKVTFDDVEAIVKKMRQEWGVTSICDIVLNHTANESEWLLD
ncbi:hypothetical protein DOY81_012036, partial [Sarcophaga bullata]